MGEVINIKKEAHLTTLRKHGSTRNEPKSWCVRGGISSHPRGLSSLPTNELPPTYDETMAGGAGGFVNPEKQEAKVQQNAYAPGVAVPPPQTTVIVQNVQFGPRPMNMICPHCQSEICTRTDSEPSATAWVLGFVICLICWPLSCVPC